MRRFRSVGLVSAGIAAAVAFVLMAPTSNSSYSDSKTGTTQTTIKVEPEPTPTATNKVAGTDKGDTQDSTPLAPPVTEQVATPEPTEADQLQPPIPTTTATEATSADDS